MNARSQTCRVQESALVRIQEAPAAAPASQIEGVAQDLEAQVREMSRERV